jgi:hypothetical protein
MIEKLKTIIKNYKEEIAHDEILLKKQRVELYRSLYLVKISAISGIIKELEEILKANEQN